MKKPIENKDFVMMIANRLMEARKAAGFSTRVEVYDRYPTWARETYASHENGRRPLTEKAAARYSTAFKVPLDYLTGADAKPTAARPKPNASFPPRYQKFPGDVSIPLRGQIAAGPNGRFIMNGQDIAHVFCPPGLEDVEGAYAVQIQGTSGEPRFYNGETAWVNPHAKVRKGDDVIIQVLGDDEDDEVSSYIKRYVSETADLLRLYQYNPDEGESHDLEFDRHKVFSIHKVVFHALL